MIRLLLLLLIFYVALRLVREMQAPRRSRFDEPSVARHAAPPSRSAYDVLGVGPAATPQEIRAAYQRLVQQYHPDRVHDLGPELREVAERRTKEINAAYHQLKRTQHA